MKDLILNFIKKYSITFVSILLFAIFSIVIFPSSKMFNISYNTDLTEVCCLISISIAHGSFMLYKLIDLYKHKLSLKIINNSVIVNSIIIIIPIILFYISIFIIDFYDKENGYALYFLLFIYNLIIFLTILKEKNINMGEYISKIFFNFLFLLLSYIVVLTGIAVLTFIYEALFNYIDGGFILRTYAFISAILLNVGYLISIEKTDTKQSLFSKILIKYVMMTMVLIGFFFFYVYLANIIISMKMPSNQVFLVCTVLFSVGLTIALMSTYFKDNTFYDKIINKLPILYLPALVLQIISIVIRIANYGMSQTRYIGVLIIIFEIAYLIVYIFKYDKLHYLFIVEAILFIMSVYIPFTNIYQFPTVYNRLCNFKSYTESLTKKNLNEQTKVVNGYRSYNHTEKDIEGYKKSYGVNISIEYNKDEDTWYYSDNKNKKIPNLYLVDVYNNKHKFITTIDLSDYLKTIENNIIKYNIINYKQQDNDKIFENTVEEILNLDTKLIINFVEVNYSEEIKGFYKVVLNGDFLTKK